MRVTSWAGSWLGRWISGDASTVLLTTLIFLLPLASVAAFSRRHGPSPALAEAAVMEAGAALLVGVGVWQAPRIFRLSERFCSGPLPWFLALLVWSSVCVVLAPEKRLALATVLPIGAGAAICGAVQRSTSSHQIKSLADALLGMVLLVSLVTVFATMAGLNQTSSRLTNPNKHVVWNAATHRGRTRTQFGSVAVSSPVSAGDRGAIASDAFLPLCLPLLLMVAYSSTNLKRRFAAGAAALASLGALAVTGTLIPAVPGLVAGLFLLVGLTGYSLPSVRSKAFFRIALALLVAAALIAAALLIPAALSRLPPVAVPELLWAAALIAFFAAGIRALPRLTVESVRPALLIGAMAGVATQVGEALFYSHRFFVPSQMPGQTLFFLSLLLGLGMACLARPAGEAAAPALTFREALRCPGGRVRLAGAMLLTAGLLALTAWTLPRLPAGGN